MPPVLAGAGRTPPRVLQSIIGYQNTRPLPASRRCCASRPAQADYTAERPRLPAGTLLSLILVIVSRTLQHVAPRDPQWLQRGYPEVGGGGGAPRGPPHWTCRLWDAEPRGVFCNATALGSKLPFFGVLSPLARVMPLAQLPHGRVGAGAWIPSVPPRLWANDGVRWVLAVGFGVGAVWVQRCPAPCLHPALVGPSSSDGARGAEPGMGPSRDGSGRGDAGEGARLRAGCVSPR